MATTLNDAIPDRDKNGPCSSFVRNTCGEQKDRDEHLNDELPSRLKVIKKLISNRIFKGINFNSILDFSTR